MSGRVLSLISKGLLYCPKTFIQRFCIPLKFTIEKNIIKLNLKNPLPKKITIKNKNLSNLHIKIPTHSLKIKAKKPIKINIDRICG